MGKVRVHLKNIVIAVLQGPCKAREVGGTQPQLAAALQQVQRVRERFLHALDQGRCSVRGTIVNHQYMELAFQGEYRLYNVLDVLPLVVGGNDD